MKAFGTSHDVAPFFKHAYECKEFAYGIFASDKSIDLMKTHIPPIKRKLLIDATFKVCPDSIFKQLLIIYVEYFTDVGIKYFFI